MSKVKVKLKVKPTTSRYSEEYLSIPVIRGHVLGVTVLRGYATICDIAKISKADVYDQKLNPTGTQRDLNPLHAKKAYEYITTQKLAFWPEVFLCARTQEVMKYIPSVMNNNIGILKINLKIATDPSTVMISRVDGNHRLHYADGLQPGFPSVDKQVSFCLAYNLTLEQEISLFRDINNNQRRMNTSHLDNIEVRLTDQDRLKKEDPYLFIAKKLGHDSESVLYNLLYEGGKRKSGQIIPLRSLKTGIKIMLPRSKKLEALKGIDAQYKVIRNYFAAVKKWLPQAWIEPKKYLVLRGAGLWGVCIIGAEVIDKSLAQGKFSIDEMLKILKSGRSWDWSNKGEFQGLGGQGGATKIATNVIRELKDESGISLSDLYGKIMEE